MEHRLGHQVLWELDGLFRQFGKANEAQGPEETTTQAAAHLINWAVDRTQCEDAWYSTLDAVLRWYLQWAGFEPNTARQAVHRVIDGHFGSWLEPDFEAVDHTCLALSRLGVDAQPESDQLQVWKEVRRQIRDDRLPSHSTHVVPVDWHERFIESADRDRDWIRADRLRVALDACRESVAMGQPLTFD